MTLKEFIEKSIISKQYQSFIIGKANAGYAEKIKNKTGLNVLGYDLIIDNYAIKHIINNHGNKEVENKKNQVAVTKNDFLLIPEILFYPDIIIKSDKANNKGLKVIKYIKQYKNKYYVIEEIRHAGKSIALNTMYIKKNLLC